MEDMGNGGLRGQERAAQLREDYRRIECFARSGEGGSWCEKAIALQLAEHQNQLRPETGITNNSIERELSREQALPWTPQTAKLVKGNFPRQVSKLLAEDTAF